MAPPLSRRLSDMARSQTTEIQYSLRDVPLFAGLRPDRLEKIQRRCAWRHYEPGEWIVDYLGTFDDVFFIAKGGSPRHHLLAFGQSRELFLTGSWRCGRGVCRH